MRAFLLSISFFALAACATTGRSSDRIEISEGACFGSCPIYDLTLSPDDRYVLNGQRFTRVNGLTEGALSEGSYAYMARLLSDADFFNLPSDITFNNPELCPGPELSDLPPFTVTWTTRRGSHTVVWYTGCRNPVMRDLRDGLRDGFGYQSIVQPG
ncbi:DUF6438 domain-containing protein [Hyphobacterium sp.]|uniref:DUF6438 domain-containing protein n=1 Tax=Hyphobacterium sp. TaxID=2004662 RepID=UPI003BAAA62A